MHEAMLFWDASRSISLQEISRAESAYILAGRFLCECMALLAWTFA